MLKIEKFSKKDWLNIKNYIYFTFKVLSKQKMGAIMGQLRFFSIIILVILSSTLYSQTRNISSIPDSINVTAVYGTSVSDSFYIANTGDADLYYNIIAYDNVSLQATMLHANGFSVFPGTGYTNSNWESVSGGAQVTGNSVTGVLTSPPFNAGFFDDRYLTFDQNFNFQPGSSAKIEYYNGSFWTEIYYQNADSTTAHQKIYLPVGPVGQLRFTGYTTKVSGNTASWYIDNIQVIGTDIVYSQCPWLRINGLSGGWISPSDSTLISYTCDATGTLPVILPGIHYANIKITFNDPYELEKIIPVHFNVIPGTPSNINTYIENDLLYVTWDEAAGADSYDIYWSDFPYGPFTYYYNTTSNLIATSTFWAKKFFYIVAKYDSK